MKRFIAGIAALMIGVMAVNAAVVVNLANGTGNDIAETTFTYSNLNGIATFDSGAMANSGGLAADGTLSGASGSLAATWTAATVTTSPGTPIEEEFMRGMAPALTIAISTCSK